MSRQQADRALFLAAGTILAALVICAFSLALETGSPTAVLLLDMGKKDTQIFPYPFTIQNFMYLAFGLGLGDAAYRWRRARAERAAASAKPLPEDASSVVTPKELPTIRQRLHASAAARGSFLLSAADRCVLHFHITSATGDTHQVLTSTLDLEMHRVDLHFSLLRYLAWVIPTLGFIGTVVGIAAALGHLAGSPEAMDASVVAVTATLYTAFNTTIVALCLSAVLVFCTQSAQRAEEEAVNQSAEYVLQHFVNRLHVPNKSR